MMGLWVVVGCESSGSPPAGEDAAVIICPELDAAPDAGPDAQFCSLEGCRPVIVLPLVYDGSDADLVGARVTVCRNDECSEGTIDAAPEVEGVGYETTLSGAVWSAEVVVTRVGQQVTFDAAVHEQDYTIPSGNVYSVAVHASDERLLGERQWTPVDYTQDPLAPACNPRCRYVVVE